MIDTGDTNDPSPPFRNQLQSTDPDALRDLLQRLLPVAMSILEEGFGVDDLIKCYNRDKAAAEAALWSAWSSFREHFVEGKFRDADDMTTLAHYFIHIAYNRWRREDRRQRKLAKAGQRCPRDFKDPSLSPNKQVEQADFSCFVRQAVEEVKGTLSGRDQRIVQMWLLAMADGRPREQRVIAQEVGVDQSTVARVLAKFQDRVRKMLSEPALE